MNSRPGTEPYLLNLSREGRGPKLVLLHGVAGSHLIFDPIMEYLTPHFEVIRLDLLGYGSSPKPKITYTAEVHIEAVRRTLIAEGIKPPYILAGLSMGCNLAFDYAQRWPEEITALVSFGFAYYPDEAEARATLSKNFWTGLSLKAPTVAATLGPVAWWAGRHSRFLADRFSGLYTVEVAQDALRASFHAFQSSLIEAMVHFDSAAALKATGGLRRLFVHGELDKWAPPEVLASIIRDYPESTLAVVADTGHNVVIIKPAETATVLKQYFADLID